MEGVEATDTAWWMVAVQWHPENLTAKSAPARHLFGDEVSGLKPHERAHRGLARCDLALGMLLPYALATSLLTIAAANTVKPMPTPSPAPINAPISHGLHERKAPSAASASVVFDASVEGYLDAEAVTVLSDSVVMSFRAS